MTVRGSEGKWLEWGGKKVQPTHYALTSPRTPEWCSEATSLPVIFFKCSNNEGEAQPCVSWTGSRPQASSESPRKTKNCLVLWSSYFFLTLKINKFGFSFFFLIIQSVSQGKPLFCIKLHILLWIPCKSRALPGLWETQVGSQQHSSVSAFHLFCWLQDWFVMRTSFLLLLLECLKYASFSRDRYLVLVGSFPGTSQDSMW